MTPEPLLFPIIPPSRQRALGQMTWRNYAPHVGDSGSRASDSGSGFAGAVPDEAPHLVHELVHGGLLMVPPAVEGLFADLDPLANLANGRARRQQRIGLTQLGEACSGLWRVRFMSSLHACLAGRRDSHHGWIKTGGAGHRLTSAHARSGPRERTDGAVEVFYVTY